MAYLKTITPEEEEGQAQPILGGESGLVGGGDGGGTMPSTSAPAGSGKGTGFVDLRRYLEENAQKTGALAEKIAGEVESKGAEVRTKADKVSSEEQTKTKGLNTYDPSWIDKVAAAPEKYTGGQDLERFTALRTGTFRGPKTLAESDAWTGAGGVKTSAGNAVQYGDLTKTPGGLETFTNSYSQDPSKGKALLNNALIQESKTAQDRLDSARQNVGMLDDYLSGKETAYGNTATDLQGALSANAPKLTNKFENIANTYGENLGRVWNDRVSSARDSRNEIVNRLNEEIARRNAVAEDQARARGQSQYGVWNPFTPYYGTPFTRSQSASAEDYAREHALEKLMGKSYNFLPDDASQAGRWMELMEAFRANDPRIGDPDEWRDVSPTPDKLPGPPPSLPSPDPSMTPTWDPFDVRNLY